jgi:hypothetical protein
LVRSIARAGAVALVGASLVATAVEVQSQAERPDFPPKETPTERTQERISELANELSRIANLHGPDAVTLQVELLTQTIRSGGVARSEVTVAGPSPAAGPTYLEIIVVSGLLFDADSTTATARFNSLWSLVAAPALEKMARFETEPPNLALVLECGVQHLGSQPAARLDPAGPYEREHFRVELTAAHLADLAHKLVTTEEILAGAHVMAGDQEITPRPSTDP